MSPHPRRRRPRGPATVFVGVLLLTAALTACGDDDPDADSTSTTSASADASTPPTELPSAGTIETEAGGTIAYSCRGEGTPAILIEAGSDSAGTQEMGFTVLEPLGEQTRTCTYDRPGTGGSPDLPDRRRTLDDACRVQSEVIDALQIPAPYILAGQSGGGGLVIACAQRHPDRIAGLMVIEGYHDSPQMMRDYQREEGWTWETNVEHLDYLDITDELDQMAMPIGEFPVVILTATDADKGNVANQAYWLDLTLSARQVVVAGSHDLVEDNRDAVVREMGKLLEAART